jgi:heptosyltransferase-2
LAADERLLEEARSRRDLARPLVAIAPGAAFGPSKRWLPERYAAVADRLAGDCAAQWTLLTGPGEEDTRDAVLTAAQTQPIALHDGASSIATLKASLAAADLLIGNDSGPRHVAVAFGTPVICVMGPTRPVYSTGPYEKGELLRIDVDCGPCQKPVCETDHRCMTRITAQAVCEAAKRWLPA